MNVVHAIKKDDQITEIGVLLKIHHGDLYADLWNIGLNMAFRISDLLEIRYENLDLENRSYTAVEKKTGKIKKLTLNKKVMGIIKRRRKEYPNDVFLFQVHSNRSKGKAPSRVHVGRIFKAIGDRLGVRLGTHSMRKTRGYVMYKSGVGIAMISKVLNHSNFNETLQYIGIEEEDVMSTYDEFEI